MSHHIKFKINKGRKDRFLKTISSSLICAFLLQEFAFANPDLFKITPQGGAEAENSKAWTRKLLPPLPESVAVIEDAWKAPDSSKTLILIQDAHTNNSCQINTAKALDLIFEKDKGIRLVFSEAAVGDNSLSFLRKYASTETRKRIAGSYLNKGLLHGVEYLDLTSDHHFTIWGVENPKLYFQSVETYRSVAKNRDKFEVYLDRVETTIKTLKPKIFNPFLLSFDEKYQKFKRQEISLTDYFDVLIQQAKQLNISIQRYPHLSDLKNIRGLESQIDFKKANEEQQFAVSKLSEADQKGIFIASKEDHSPFRLSSDENKTGKAFFALLEEKLAKGTSQYPELTKYFYYLKQARQIQAKEILKEQKLLEEEIFRKLSTNDDESNLLRASRNIDSLKKLLNLTLTPEDFDEYRKDKQSFDITRITGFLNRKIMDLRKDYERAVFLENGYEGIVKQCEKFYSLTYHRDMEFVKNLTYKMDKEDQRKSVLITGGYHSPNLKYLLKEKGISYVCLTPQVLQETNLKRYESLLLSQYANTGRNSSFALHSQGMPSFNMTGYSMGQAIPPPSGAQEIIEDIGGERSELIRTPVLTGARMAEDRSQALDSLMGDHDMLKLLSEVFLDIRVTHGAGTERRPWEISRDMTAGVPNMWVSVRPGISDQQLRVLVRTLFNQRPLNQLQDRDFFMREAIQEATEGLSIFKFNTPAFRKKWGYRGIRLIKARGEHPTNPRRFRLIGKSSEHLETARKDAMSYGYASGDPVKSQGGQRWVVKLWRPRWYFKASGARMADENEPVDHLQMATSELKEAWEFTLEIISRGDEEEIGAISALSGDLKRLYVALEHFSGGVHKPLELVEVWLQQVDSLIEALNKKGGIFRTRLTHDDRAKLIGDSGHLTNAREHLQSFIEKLGGTRMADAEHQNPETILNGHGQSLDDVWAIMQAKGFIFSNVTDPRAWSVENNEEEAIADRYARMTLEELGQEFRDLGFEGLEGVADPSKLTNIELLRAFLDLLSIDAGMDKHTYGHFNHHFVSPLSRIKGTREFLNREGKKPLSPEIESQYKTLLLDGYKYKSFIREITRRWQYSDKETAGARLSEVESIVDRVRRPVSFALFRNQALFVSGIPFQYQPEVLQKLIPPAPDVVFINLKEWLSEFKQLPDDHTRYLKQEELGRLLNKEQKTLAVYGYENNPELLDFVGALGVAYNQRRNHDAAHRVIILSEEKVRYVGKGFHDNSPLGNYPQFEHLTTEGTASYYPGGARLAEQRIIPIDTQDIPNQELLGEKAYKLLRMVRAGFNIPPFFVVIGNKSGELEVNEALTKAFQGLKKPVIVRSSHPEEGKKYSFSGVFASYQGILELDEPKPGFSNLPEDERNRRLWEYRFEEPKSLTDAYRRIVELSSESRVAIDYLQEHQITEFQPKDMNAVVMEELTVDIFGMFITSDQNNPDKIQIHYEIRTGEPRGGVVTYDKKNHRLELEGLDESVTKALLEFGEVAEKIENLFGVHQIELASSNGKTYVLQSRTINLKNPKDVPRFPKYETLAQDLRAISYGYYTLPIIVIDDIENTDHSFSGLPEYKQLEANFMAIPSTEKEKKEEARKAVEGFVNKRRNAYKEELSSLKKKFGDYILVIRNPHDIMKEAGHPGKDYGFLNSLVREAKVVIRGRNQNAIRHEDWDNVEKGGITIIPPEGGYFMDIFRHKKDYGEQYLATGDQLSILSNTDGVFVWAPKGARLAEKHVQEPSEKPLAIFLGAISVKVVQEVAKHADVMRVIGDQVMTYGEVGQALDIEFLKGSKTEILNVPFEVLVEKIGNRKTPIVLAYDMVQALALRGLVDALIKAGYDIREMPYPLYIFNKPEDEWSQTTRVELESMISRTFPKGSSQASDGARLATDNTEISRRDFIAISAVALTSLDITKAFDDFVVGTTPKPGQSIAVSLKAGGPSILTFKESKSPSLIDVYVGGEYFKTVDTTKKIKDEVAHISVADMIGILREVNQRYNQEVAPELQSVPIEAYVHLNSYKGLPENLQESMIASELGSIVARRANYKAIHLVGDEELVKKAYAIIDGMRSLKSKRGLFVTGDAVQFQDANHVHILTKDYFLANPDIRKDPKRRFVTLDNIHYDQANRTVDVVAFNPVVSFMEMVGTMDDLSKEGNTFSLAYEFFKQITGYDLTRDEFLGFLQGNPNLVRRFALPPAIRAIDINLALRVWAIGARMAAQAA